MILSGVCNSARYGGLSHAGDDSWLPLPDPAPGGGAGGGPNGTDRYRASCSMYGRMMNDQWNAAGLYGLFCWNVSDPAPPVVGSWIDFCQQLGGSRPVAVA